MTRTSLASYVDDFLTRGTDTAFAHTHGLRVRRWSYRQTAETALRFARELDARRIAKGDRVLIWAKDSPDWVAAFFGCVLRGVIAVPLDLQSEPGFVKRVHDQVEPKLALCDAATLGLVDTLPVMALDELSSQIAHHSSKPDPVAGHGYDDTLEIIFTSGTTAEPKGVCITHRNFLANLAPLEREIKRYLKWERAVHPIRFLNLVPLSHVFGQFMGIFVPPLLGGPVFFQEALAPSQIIDTVKGERISVVVCVPRILETLREKIELDFDARGQLDTFRSRFDAAAGSHFLRRWWTFRRVHQMFGWKFWAFISGGATINPDTEEFWQRLGFAVLQGYGMTETASLVSVNHPFKKGRGSIGKVLSGQEVKLAENGEILVRGQNVSPGYWKGEGQSRAADDGWYRTGDAGEIDADGNLYFRGRQKEVIVTSAGMNIYPEDIERVLNRQPEIKATAVVGLDGARGPEALAVVILRDDQASARAAIERANESLAQHQQVRRWAVWPDEDFPRTTTQKIRKPVVADRMKATLDVASPEWTNPSSSSSSAARLERLEGILSRVSGEVVERLDPSAKLGTDLKLDSLARVELLSALEDSYHIEIDEAAFTETTTVADVEKILREGTHEEAPQYSYPSWQHRWPITWLRVALLYLIVLPLTKLTAWPTIRNMNRWDAVRGPVVFVCNHITLVDHAIVLLALPGRFRRTTAIAMDAETLHKWLHPPPHTPLMTRVFYLLQYVLAILFFNGFYMPQKSGFRRSFVRAGELMDRGYNVLVFPEGQRTKHGRLHPFLPGTGLLISKLNAPVIPMRIDGLWELKKAHRHFARPGEISLTIGEPLRYSARDGAERIARDLEEVVRGL